MPERAVAEGLVEALADVPVERALIARAAEGRDVLPDALRERGAHGGRRRAVRDGRRAARRRDPRRGGRAPTTCCSPRRSSVRFFVAAAGADALRGPRLASIGPATSAELRAHGAEPDLEADPHTPDGLIEALLRDAARMTATDHVPVRLRARATSSSASSTA